MNWPPSPSLKLKNRTSSLAAAPAASCKHDESVSHFEERQIDLQAEERYLSGLGCGLQEGHVGVVTVHIHQLVAFPDRVLTNEHGQILHQLPLLLHH
jgi:hypothetical protein